MKGRLKGDRLVAVALLGFLLLNYPLLALFDSSRLVLGVPALYLYIFGAWALLIVIMAAIVGRS